jgi:glycosyltransferase involved in cell wall biosynthesis
MVQGQESRMWSGRQQAVTWFFQQEEGIILDDDCLPSLSFFEFCEFALAKFIAALNRGEKHMTELSIIVPVYKEESNVPEFIRQMTPILSGLTLSYEIIFALDPSPDKTEEVILEAHLHDPRIKLLKFSRRFGQPMATLAGLQYAAGEAVIVMDVDLQDPPELIQPMFEKWKEGYDVVYAQRKNREGETWIKKVVSVVGYKVINRIAEVNIPPNTGDFRLMSRRVVAEINRLKECHGFLRGMVALVGFRQTSILFDRPPRFAGRGNYNPFLGSLRIGFNGIFCLLRADP